MAEATYTVTTTGSGATIFVLGTATGPATDPGVLAYVTGHGTIPYRSTANPTARLVFVVSSGTVLTVHTSDDSIPLSWGETETADVTWASDWTDADPDGPMGYGSPTNQLDEIGAPWAGLGGDDTVSSADYEDQHTYDAAIAAMTEDVGITPGLHSDLSIEWSVGGPPPLSHESSVAQAYGDAKLFEATTPDAGFDVQPIVDQRAAIDWTAGDPYAGLSDLDWAAGLEDGSIPYEWESAGEDGHPYLLRFVLYRSDGPMALDLYNRLTATDGLFGAYSGPATGVTFQLRYGTFASSADVAVWNAAPPTDSWGTIVQSWTTSAETDSVAFADGETLLLAGTAPDFDVYHAVQVTLSIIGDLDTVDAASWVATLNGTGVKPVAGAFLSGQLTADFAIAALFPDFRIGVYNEHLTPLTGGVTIVLPLRQKQRDDGLALSGTPRWRARTSRQGSNRWRGYL